MWTMWMRTLPGPRQRGAAIQSEPEDMFWGDRMYTCADLEGHLWFFATHVRDVPPEEMKMPQP